MFGFDKVIGGILNTGEKFIRDPIGTSINIATQPLRDAVDVIDGLSEGELRIKAALSLGADVVSGMALSELIEWYSD